MSDKRTDRKSERKCKRTSKGEIAWELFCGSTNAICSKEHVTYKHTERERERDEADWEKAHRELGWAVRQCEGGTMWERSTICMDGAGGFGQCGRKNIRSPEYERKM